MGEYEQGHLQDQWGSEWFKGSQEKIQGIQSNFEIELKQILKMQSIDLWSLKNCFQLQSFNFFL